MKRFIASVSEAGNIFPNDTEFQNQAYNRLFKAYVAVHYDQSLEIEKGVSRYLEERVKSMLDLAMRSCEK